MVRCNTIRASALVLGLCLSWFVLAGSRMAATILSFIWTHPEEDRWPLLADISPAGGCCVFRSFQQTSLYIISAPSGYQYFCEPIPCPGNPCGLIDWVLEPINNRGDKSPLRASRPIPGAAHEVSSSGSTRLCGQRCGWRCGLCGPSTSKKIMIHWNMYI